MIIMILYCIFYRLTMVFSQSFGIYSEIDRSTLPQDDRFDGIEGVRLPGGTDVGSVGLMLGVVPDGVQVAVDAPQNVRAEAVAHDDRPMPPLRSHAKVVIDQRKVGTLRLPDAHDAGDVHLFDVLEEKLMYTSKHKF